MNPVQRIDIIGGVTAVALISAVGFFTVRPILSERNEVRSRLIQLASIEADTESALQALRATGRALNESRALAEGLPDHFRREADRNSKISEIVTQAESFGLEVQEIIPGTIQRGEQYARTPVDVNLQGSIAAVARYLHLLHEESSDLEITRLEITAAATNAFVDAQIRADWITITE